MRYTDDVTTVMKRLADLLGWTLESSGRSWTVTHVPEKYGERVDLEGLSWKNVSMISFMLRVATAPRRYRGLGLSPFEVVETIKWRVPERDRNGNQPLPSGLDATDEATWTRFLRQYWEEKERRESQAPLDRE